MKVLLASSLYEPNVVGGAERVVQLLAKSLGLLGHEVAVITTQPRGPAAHAMVNGVSVHYVPVRNLHRPFSGYAAGAVHKVAWRALDSYNFLMRESLGRIVDLEKPDVLNSHNLTGLSVSLWTEAHERRLPIVHTLHDQYLMCHRSTMFKPPRNCKRRCFECRLLTAPRKYATRRVHETIGVSQFILERHRRLGFFNSHASSVIYNTALAKPPQSPRRAADAGVFRFGYLGQIIPTKSVRELIDAFLSSGLGKAELWLAGKRDSQYAVNLERETRRHDHIRWMGFVDPAEFLHAIDVLVVPSQWHDTAPLVILEAFGHGVPVLGATRGGIPELIPAGCGWLFDPDEAGALARALARCAASSSRLDDMRLACIECAQKAADAPWAQAYVAAYRRAIATASSSAQ